MTSTKNPFQYNCLSSGTPRDSDSAPTSDETGTNFDLKAFVGSVPQIGEDGQPMLAGQKFFHMGKNHKYCVRLTIDDSPYFIIATGDAIESLQNALPGMPITWGSFQHTTGMGLIMCTFKIMGIEFSVEVSEETYKFLAKALPLLSPFLSIEDHPPAGLYDRLSTPRSDAQTSDEQDPCDVTPWGVVIPRHYPQTNDSRSLKLDSLPSD